jgi:universal stress protein A
MAIYNHIVCCLDFSKRADKAFATAKSLAMRDGARLTLLHVANPLTPLLPGEPPQKRLKLSDAEKAARLREYIAEHYLNDTPELKVVLELRQGHPSVEIVTFLQESGADLVVVGAEGFRGVNLILLGSVAEEVSRKAHCSCLLVR